FQCGGNGGACQFPFDWPYAERAELPRGIRCGCDRDSSEWGKAARKDRRNPDQSRRFDAAVGGKEFRPADKTEPGTLPGVGYTAGAGIQPLAASLVCFPVFDFYRPCIGWAAGFVYRFITCNFGTRIAWIAGNC